MIKSGGSRQG